MTVGDELQQPGAKVGLDVRSDVGRQRHFRDAATPHLSVEREPDHARMLHPAHVPNL